jgi:hypothetical protein
LTDTNYNEWRDDILAILQKHGLKRFALGTIPKPANEDSEAIERWITREERTSGYILTSLDATQKVHIQGLEDKPAEMWVALREAHQNKKPGTRINALAELLEARQREDESLTAWFNRTSTLKNQVTALTDDKMTTDDVYNELQAMTALRNVSDKHSLLKKQLLLTPDLMNKKDILQAFQSGDIEDRRAEQAYAASTGYKFTEIGETCVIHGPGHSTSKCYTIISAKKRKEEREKDQMPHSARGRSSEKRSPKNQSKKSYAHKDDDKANLATSAFTDKDTDTVSAFAVQPSESPAHSWILDSGATRVMTPHRHHFTNYRKCQVPVRVANGSIVYSVGAGDIIFRPVNLPTITYTSALHIPSLTCNLFSFVKFTQSMPTRKTTFLPDRVLITDNGDNILTASYRNGLPYLDLETDTAYLSSQELHSVLGHISSQTLQKIVKNEYIENLKISDDKMKVCEPCIMGHQTRKPFPLSSTRATKKLELIHTDLHDTGHISRTGTRYWVSFIDDYTRYTWMYPLRLKSDTFQVFAKWKAMVERESNCSVIKVRDDMRRIRVVKIQEAV